jgi:hypothetical protein
MNNITEKREIKELKKKISRTRRRTQASNITNVIEFNVAHNIIIYQHKL